MPSIHPTRSQRIEKIVRRLSNSYQRRKASGRLTDHQLARIKCLTQSYCDAMEAERCCEL